METFFTFFQGLKLTFWNPQQIEGVVQMIFFHWGPFFSFRVTSSGESGARLGPVNGVTRAQEKNTPQTKRRCKQENP